MSNRSWPRGSHLRAASIALTVLAALPLTGCSRSNGGGAKPPAAAESISLDPAKTEVVTVTYHDCPLVVRVQGSLIGDEHSVIGAKVAGRVKDSSVDLGAVVRRGQVLATLDTEEFDLRVLQAQAQLDQARAALGLKSGDPESSLDREKAPPVREAEAVVLEAKATLDRGRELERKNQNLITKEDVQQREATLAVAVARKAAALNGVEEKIALLSVRRAELAMAQQVQLDAVIAAPFDGIVQERHVAPGVYVSVGRPVVTLVRVDPLRYRAGVPEREALMIQAGLPVVVMIEGLGKPVAAKITRISPALDMSNRSLTIEADIPNPDSRLRAGLFAEAEIMIDTRAQALAVPARAITQFAGVEKVTLLVDGKPKEVQVATGRRVGELVEIRSGLKDGDQVMMEVREATNGTAEE